MRDDLKDLYWQNLCTAVDLKTGSLSVFLNQRDRDREKNDLEALFPTNTDSTTKYQTHPWLKTVSGRAQNESFKGLGAVAQYYALTFEGDGNIDPAGRSVLQVPSSVTRDAVVRMANALVADEKARSEAAKNSQQASEIASALGTILGDAAYAMAMNDYRLELDTYTSGVAADPDEYRMRTLAAMAEMGRLNESAAEAINSFVTGRSNTRVSFLADDGLRDDPPAADVYKAARARFAERVEADERDLNQCKAQFADFCDMQNQASLFGSAKNMPQPMDYTAIRDAYFAAPEETAPAAKGNAIRANSSRMRAMRSALQEAVQRNWQTLDIWESAEFIRGSQEAIPKKLPSGADDLEKIDSNIQLDLRGIIAVEAVRDGRDFVKDGFSKTDEADLKAVRENNQEAAVRQLDSEKIPKVKRPNAWVRFWSKYGYYKDTMQKWKEQTKEYEYMTNRDKVMGDLRSLPKSNLSADTLSREYLIYAQDAKMNNAHVVAQDVWLKYQDEKAQAQAKGKEFTESIEAFEERMQRVEEGAYDPMQAAFDELRGGQAYRDAKALEQAQAKEEQVVQVSLSDVMAKENPQPLKDENVAKKAAPAATAPEMGKVQKDGPVL